MITPHPHCEACLAEERGDDNGLVQSIIDTYIANDETGFLCDYHLRGTE